MKKYLRYLESDAWKAKRAKKIHAGVHNRTHAWCRGCKCMVPKKWIHIHHLTYRNLYAEPLEDLAVLCAGCHAYLHGQTTPTWWDEARAAGKLGCFSKRRLIKDIKANKAGNDINGYIACQSVFIHDDSVQLKTVGDFLFAGATEVSIKRRAATVEKRKRAFGIAS